MVDERSIWAEMFGADFVYYENCISNRWQIKLSFSFVEN